MNFKQLSADMTEQALCILMAIAPSADGEKVVDIADSLGMGDPEVEFILQQFVEFNIATKNGWGRYALTPEYRAYKRGRI
ncbi:TPA: hypothetical protein ACGD48_004768 [Serratia marcescens]|uniref:hypothetical protein n=1 Tax=Serratia marcescens TaxID=615 RepID=UPI00156D55DE|nr:hypothetical protein [Serratia marcescens]NSL16512.1 hypothetical protein [Serratia marcescens]